MNAGINNCLCHGRRIFLFLSVNFKRQTLKVQCIFLSSLWDIYHVRARCISCHAFPFFSRAIEYYPSFSPSNVELSIIENAWRDTFIVCFCLSIVGERNYRSPLRFVSTLLTSCVKLLYNGSRHNNTVSYSGEIWYFHRTKVLHGNSD